MIWCVNGEYQIYRYIAEGFKNQAIKFVNDHRNTMQISHIIDILLWLQSNTKVSTQST